jgi:heat shock transcription factor 1
MKNLSKKRNTKSKDKKINPYENKISSKNKKNKEKSTKKEELTNFLLKLYQILENPEYNKIINWIDNGKGFIIENLYDFTENILPKYYRHKNYSSFVRQLNMYDFHKKKNLENKFIFHHENFIKDKKDLIKKIKRKNKRNLIEKEIKEEYPLEQQKNKETLIGFSTRKISEKTTKNSIENIFNQLIKNVQFNSNRQKNLEEKIEKLGKQNDNFLNHIQTILHELINKTDYNNKLESITSFFVQMILSSPSQKGNNDWNNFLISNEINCNKNNNNIKLNMNKLNLNEINTMMMPFNIIHSQNNFINNNNNNDSFKKLFDNYIEINKSNNNSPKMSFNNKINLPMLTCGDKKNNLSSISPKSFQLSPIRFKSRKGSFDSFNNINNNLGDSILSNNSKNLFDFENIDSNKSYLGSFLNCSLNNFFDNHQENNKNLKEGEKDIKNMFNNDK